MKKFWLFFLFFNLFFAPQIYPQEEAVVSIDRRLESGELEQAKILLEKKFSPESLHYEFLLAKIRFYQGEYLLAKEKLGEMVKKQPDDKNLQEIYQFYNAVYEKNKDFQEYASEHFRLRLKPEDEILKDYTLENLEKIYARLGKEFNYYPKEKILVEIHNTKDSFLTASTLNEKEVNTSGAIGICKFNRLMIISPRLLAYGYRWLDSLSHEYVHYLVNRLTLYHCPLWLHEGIARYFDRKWLDKPVDYLSPPYENLLANAYKENKLISFARMSPSLVKLNSQEEVSLAFAQVANTVDYLIRSYGQEKLLSLLNELKTNKNEDISFNTVYGLNQGKIEKTWQESLKGKEMKTYPGVSIEKIKFVRQGISPDELEEEVITSFVGTDLRGHIRLGDKFRLRGKYETALAEYEEALEKEPHNPVILNKIAKVYLALNRKEEAEKKLLNAIKTNPDYGAGYFNLANLYLEVFTSSGKKYKEAEENYQEYIQINPFDPYLHKNLGILYYKSGENAKAKKEFLITKKLLPYDLEIESILNRLGK